ncbi:MAG: hypothetical protein WAT09_05480 [Paracoccaceae bacterium]
MANDDADGDGQISVDEAADSPAADLLAQAFGTIDSDSDGQLTKDEMSLAASNGVPVQPRSGRSERPEGGQGGSPPGGKIGSPPGGQGMGQVGGADDSQPGSTTSLYESLFNVLIDSQAGEQTSSLSAKLAQQTMDALEYI